MRLFNSIKSYPRIDIINYLILAYAFFLAFPDEIKRIIAIIMILLWITDRTKYDFKLPKTNLFLAFNIFICYSLLSYLWNDVSFAQTIDYVKKYWHYIPCFIIFKYLKKEYIFTALNAFLSGILINEILAYGNLFELWQIGYGHKNSATVFYTHTMYSIFLAVASMILLIRSVYEKQKKARILYLIFYTTVTLNLLVNTGRTGQIALVCTLVITVIYIFRKKIKYIFSIFILLNIILTLSYFYNPIFKNRINFIHHDITSIIYDNHYHTSIGGRIGFWILSRDIIIENPVLGAGVVTNINEAKKLVKEKYPHLAYNSSLAHFHSDYLKILTSLGLIGFSIFCFILYEIIKIKINNNKIKLMKLVTISVFLIASLADIVFYAHTTISLFAFIIGLALAQYKIEYNKKVNNDKNCSYNTNI